MLTESTLQSTIDRIVATANPSQVWLFGSHPRGEPTEDSDPDLLVIETEVPDRGAEMARLRRAVGAIGIGVDILVCSEQEAARRGQVPGTVLYWALKEGKVLYDARA